MSDASQQSSAKSEATTENKVGFLDAAIKATKQTDRNHAEALLKTFAEQAMKGVVKVGGNFTKSIDQAIAGSMNWYPSSSLP